MPRSDPEPRSWVIDKIKSIDPYTILDIGAGEGTWADLLNHLNKQIDAIEVFKPYIEKYGLRKKYDSVFNVNVLDWDDFNYDLVILGDVLEHMTKDEAITLMERVASSAKYAIITIPIIHFPQGIEENNPFERHIKDDWTHQEVLDTFLNIEDSKEFKVVGAYWLCYNL